MGEDEASDAACRLSTAGSKLRDREESNDACCFRRSVNNCRGTPTFSAASLRVEAVVENIFDGSEKKDEEDGEFGEFNGEGVGVAVVSVEIGENAQVMVDWDGWDEARWLRKMERMGKREVASICADILS